MLIQTIGEAAHETAIKSENSTTMLRNPTIVEHRSWHAPLSDAHIIPFQLLSSQAFNCLAHFAGRLFQGLFSG